MVDEAKFLERGYAVVPAEDLRPLVDLRRKICKKAAELIGKGDEDPERFLNNFHRSGMQGASLNEARMTLIKYITEQLHVGPTLFDIFSDTITQLIGPDVLVQKTTNVVVQQPGDPEVTPVHRDSPLNSPFEIVVWLPLVNTYSTKSMYVLDRGKSETALELLGQEDSSYQEVLRYLTEKGDALTVPFGHAAFFWPGLVHGCDVNREDETRWALNIRYKNLFSPVGAKGLSEFFDLLTLSPLAQIALDYERKARLEGSRPVTVPRLDQAVSKQEEMIP